ncbi:MAG: Dihydrolipoyllysine-residue acetyltransferase component of pyruvate dehydrogenase complex [Owenweeksia sp. TMED14]|nr:MAG: Dihydrolipoyllysine-residue acetyltransferase component of pyruvate dehydrogenase complex [Owenweeksia sp. TMED14]
MFELIMPKMGESVAEATITEWLKKEGDTIKMDESILTIATDKVDSDLPSPVSGFLAKILFNVDDVIQVGQVIAHIKVENEEPTDIKVENERNLKRDEEIVLNSKTIITEEETDINISVKSNISRESSGRFYSPLVRSIAEEEGVSQEDLDKIIGSGNEGRVTKRDLIAFIDIKKKNPNVPGPENTSKEIYKTEEKKIVTPNLSNPTPYSLPGDEIIEMDRMRRLISDHMVMSKHVSPHVTSFVEADVTSLVLWRKKVKSDYENRENSRLTFTPIFLEAVTRAIKDFPNINVSVDGNNIIAHKPINIGMATALPNGNLIVPVIKNADRYSLSGLAKEVNQLAEDARNNKLKPDDIKGGTYTVTNVGTFGNVMGTPIINQPQVAILALGAIRKIPAVIETSEGDVIAIRHKMFLSHSYDHRVVDGALGGMFVKRVADYLEKWDTERVI